MNGDRDWLVVTVRSGIVIGFLWVALLSTLRSESHHSLYWNTWIARRWPRSIKRLFVHSIVSVSLTTLLGFLIRVSVGTPVQGRHLLSRNPHQDCLSNGSDGQFKRNLSEQHHQLQEQAQVYTSLVTSILFYGCETWSLLAESGKRIQAFETKCLRKLLRIPYLEYKTSDWVRSKISFIVGPQEPLLATAKRQKSAWFGHVTLTTASLKPSFMAPWRVGDVVVGRGNAGWITSNGGTFLPVSGSPIIPFRRKDWTRISAESSLMCPRLSCRLVALWFSKLTYMNTSIQFSSLESFDPTTQSVKELNRIELKYVFMHVSLRNYNTTSIQKSLFSHSCRMLSTVKMGPKP